MVQFEGLDEDSFPREVLSDLTALAAKLYLCLKIRVIPGALKPGFGLY